MGKSGTATIEQKDPKQCPLIRDGSLDSDLLSTWFDMAESYFTHKVVDDAKKVQLIATGFQDPLIRMWYRTNRVSLQAMTWDDFVDEMYDQWLPDGWDSDLHADILRMTMSESQSFEDFVRSVEMKNVQLSRSLLVLDDDALRTTITPRLTRRLRLLAQSDAMATIKKYRSWKQTMTSADREYASQVTELRSQLIVRDRDKSRSDSRSTRPPFSSSSRPNTNTPSSSSRPASRVPPLTESERSLLMANKGCLKCRRFHAGHLRDACPNGFPDATTYKTLTQADVDAKPTASSKTHSSNRKPVAAVVQAVSRSVSPDDVAAPVGAIRSVHSVAALGTDSDDEAWISEGECVLSSPSIVWSAHIVSHSGPTDTVEMLIDTGSPVVLIEEQLATSYNLRKRRLHKPFEYTDAFDGEERVAHHWCSLRAAAPDGSFSSRSCRAIIVPKLCHPIVLGTPFLGRNNLVVDVSNHAVWDAHGVDILTNTSRTSRPSPPIAPPSESEQRVIARELACLDHRLLRAQRRDIHRQVLTDVPLFDGVDSGPSPRTICAVRSRVEDLAFAEKLSTLDARMKLKFANLFPADIPPLHRLPDDVHHEIHLKDANLSIVRRTYDCPKKYRESWKTLLDQHLAAGRLRPSSSPYASPSFLVPKADPTALPRWVNDYRTLNANTIPDAYPLPSIQEILSDCARGKIWGKLDMTNSFFQTKVHPDHIKYTAVTTPFGLYEWTVMPQGCRNAPSTHQRRMYNALRPFIGSICHVYLDDIIIWSSDLKEHIRNVQTILTALDANSLYCSLKKTDLFCTQLNFLGHNISRDGVRPDGSKVARILDWPTPKSATDVRAFLGLVRYISNFLPKLAEFTTTLNPLTTKDAEKNFVWTPDHAHAFDAVKRLVTSHECLTAIDHNNLGENHIFVSTDASDYCTGAVLSYGPTLESARPVAFESCQLSGAELNYPVHEKELLAIVRALKKWRVDLLGVPFTVFTDHRTLENFSTQRHLSRRQARWQEFLGQYDYQTLYIRGEDNSVADSLSRLRADSPDSADTTTHAVGALRLLRAASVGLGTRRAPSHRPPVAAVGSSSLHIATDPDWLTRIRDGYAADKWCLRLLGSLTNADDPLVPLRAGDLDGSSVAGIRVDNGLLFAGDRLCIPRVTDLRESLYRLAHDSLGHFGSEKSYASLRSSYYWPNMRRDLEALYIPSCDPCQPNKTSPTRPTGPLHPLPVPDRRFDCIAIDFVGTLPTDDGFDCIATITDRLGADIRLIPCRSDMSAEAFAGLFFQFWYCENGLPLHIVSDRDKLFVSRFWKALHKLSGVDLRMSTSFHPESDGASERTNRTVIQLLRYHVARNQTGWVRALPLVRFQLMNTVNASTGFSPFQLRLGVSPRVLPPLFDQPATDACDPAGDEASRAAALIARIETDVLEAQDNLVLAKASQAVAANAHRGPEVPYAVGDRVLLSTFHRRRDYMQRGDHRVAKFMVRFDGPFRVCVAHPETSSYTLDLPSTMKIHPTFHASLLKPYRANDDELFPRRSNPEPGPVITPDGQEEFFVEKILDHRRIGRGHRFLVRWYGYGPGSDSWLPGRDVKDLVALDDYLKTHSLDLAIPQ